MGSFLLDFDEELKSIVDNEKRCIKLCENMISINTEEVKKALKKGIEFSLKNELHYAYSYFNYFMGRIIIEGDIDESVLIYATEAYSNFEEMGLEDEVLMSMNIFLLYYMREENVEKCLEWAVTALDLAEISGNQQRISMIKLNLATFYRELGKYKEARDIYMEVEKLAISVSKENKIRLFLGRAICEAELNNIEEASEYLEIANEFNYKNEIDEAEIYYADATISFKNEDLVRAEKDMLISMDILKKLGIKTSIHEQSILLSKIYLKQNRLDDIISILENLDKNIENRKKKSMMIKIYQILEDVYKRRDDFKNAYIYAKKVSDLEKEELMKCNNREHAMLKRKKEEDEERTYKLLYRQTEMLYGVGNKLTSNLNKENIFNIIANEIQNIINYDVVQIATYSEKKKKYIYDINIEQNKELSMKNFEVKEGTIASYCIENKEDILISNIDKEYSKFISNYEAYENYIKQELNEGESKRVRGAKSAIFVPIIIDKRLIGIVSVQSYKCNSYDLKDLTTLKILSTYIGIALENSKLFQMMEYTATHDYLTGLLNRRETITRSEVLYDEFEEEKESLVVTIIDVDNFKRINDTYGHLTGDKVIEAVGHSIKESLGEEAIVGRYGGEEFVAIFKTKSFIKANLIGETMRENIENLNLKSLNGETFKTTASIGMVEITNKSKSFSEIIGQADKAMYKGKKSGKNRLVYEKI